MGLIRVRCATFRSVGCAQVPSQVFSPPCLVRCGIMQIQGMDWLNLPKNIPTISNMPWAIGPNVTHRNDWGNAERACVMLSGDDCVLDTTTSFDHCAIRCVGTGTPGFHATDYGWNTPEDRASVGHPQGNVSTLAGNGQPGYKDGWGSEAQFDNPTGIIVDRDRNVCVPCAV